MREFSKKGTKKSVREFQPGLRPNAVNQNVNVCDVVAVFVHGLSTPLGHAGGNLLALPGGAAIAAL